MSATRTHRLRPRRATLRAALLLTAGIAVTGCAPGSEPVANRRTAAPHSGIAASPAMPSGHDRPAPAGGPQGPATTSTIPARTSATTAPAAPAPPAAEVTLADLLVNVDEALADLDAELTGAAQDAATPEGDLG